MITGHLSARATEERLLKLGFRRWYERQLIESHLWLVSCFICIILVAAGIELLGDRKSAGEFLADAVLIIGGAALGWISWRRYAATMMQAQSLGMQAVCKQCRHYGFRLAPPENGQWLARCTRCRHQWTLERLSGDAAPSTKSSQ